MESPLVQGFLNFLIAGGTASVLYTAGRGFWRWATGRAGRERIRTRTIADERDMARNERDDEFDYRIILQEYASVLRRMLIERGFEAVIPPWPQNPANDEKRRPRDNNESRRHLRRRREDADAES